MNSTLFKVVNLKKPTRVFDYILENPSLVLPSKTSVKKAFKRAQIFVNGIVATPGDWLKVGDEIVFKTKDLAQQKVFPLSLEVLYEDEFIAVINKPAGYAVSGNFYKTIQNALSSNIALSSQIDALLIPRPVHRLDKLTSGILVIAKTKSAQINLSKQFENQAIEKTYYALVKGKIEGSGFFDAPIASQSAFTSYTSVQVEKSLSYSWVSLVELTPKTGRTHQLRIHLAHAGYPIIGDYLYDSNSVLKGKGLFLCASKIGFTHPNSKEFKTFELPIPNKYASLFERELRRWNKFNSKV